MTFEYTTENTLNSKKILTPISFCTKPVKDNIVCPYCIDKERCQIQNIKVFQLFLQETQQ
jgi:hypothetical protein